MFIEFNRCSLISMDACGCFCILVDFHRFPLIVMDVNGFLWTCMDFHGFRKVLKGGGLSASAIGLHRMPAECGP